MYLNGLEEHTHISIYTYVNRQERRSQNNKREGRSFDVSNVNKLECNAIMPECLFFHLYTGFILLVQLPSLQSFVLLCVTIFSSTQQGIFFLFRCVRLSCHLGLFRRDLWFWTRKTLVKQKWTTMLSDLVLNRLIEACIHGNFVLNQFFSFFCCVLWIWKHLSMDEKF